MNLGINCILIAIFKASRNNYGTRRIKQELSRKGMIVNGWVESAVLRRKAEDFSVMRTDK